MSLTGVCAFAILAGVTLGPLVADVHEHVVGDRATSVSVRDAPNAGIASDPSDAWIIEPRRVTSMKSVASGQLTGRALRRDAWAV
ncbi:hypothetical protein PMI11_00721 [Rhizobium sp. CF142]|nr:hypothetical protein PMI11_00721 [Rhizobium sp. CF142]